MHLLLFPVFILTYLYQVKFQLLGIFKPIPFLYFPYRIMLEIF